MSAARTNGAIERSPVGETTHPRSGGAQPLTLPELLDALESFGPRAATLGAEAAHPPLGVGGWGTNFGQCRPWKPMRQFSQSSIPAARCQQPYGKGHL